MRLLMLIGALLVSGAAAPAVAGPLEDAVAAFEKDDYATALRLLRPLAEQGEVRAQHRLGVCTNTAPACRRITRRQRRGTARPLSRATPAQAGLGVLYFNGQGVRKDYVRAHMWWNLNATQGYGQSFANGDNVAARMTPAQIAEAQKLAREWKPKR